MASANPSKEIFDPKKRYKRVIFSNIRPLVDFELNSTQDILREEIRVVKEDIVGNEALSGGFEIVASSDPNEIIVKKGVVYHKGNEVRVFEDSVIDGLTTPFINRIDYVYVKYKFREVDAIEDPNLIDPGIGVETATRMKLDLMIGVAEGGPMPVPVGNEEIFRVGRLERIGGNDFVTLGMIKDERIRLRETYIISGGEILKEGALSVRMKECICRIGDIDYTVAEQIKAVPANQTSYIIIDELGIVIVDSYRETGFEILLAKVVTDASQITLLEERRTGFGSNYKNVAEEVRKARGSRTTLDERLSQSLNPDGTIKPEAKETVGVREIEILRPEITIPASLKLYVNKGRYQKIDGTGSVWFGGGLSPLFYVPVANKRIDLLMIDVFGTLSIFEGEPAPVPIVPDYWGDKIVIAEVSLYAGQTAIVEENIADARPFIGAGGGGGLERIYLVGEQLLKGDVVRISGNMTVEKASASGIATASAVGVAMENIFEGFQGKVRIGGGIDVVQFEEDLILNAGEEVYLSKSVPGALTNVAPISPGVVVEVGIIEDMSAYVGSNPENSKCSVLWQVKKKIIV